MEGDGSLFCWVNPSIAIDIIKDLYNGMAQHYDLKINTEMHQ